MPIIIGAETPVIQAARIAAAAGMFLVTDGRRTMASETVPPGWFRVSVNAKAREAS